MKIAMPPQHCVGVDMRGSNPLAGTEKRKKRVRRGKLAEAARVDRVRAEAVERRKAQYSLGVSYCLGRGECRGTRRGLSAGTAKPREQGEADAQIRPWLQLLPTAKGVSAGLRRGLSAVYRKSRPSKGDVKAQWQASAPVLCQRFKECRQDEAEAIRCVRKSRGSRETGETQSYLGFRYYQGPRSAAGLR